MTIPPDRSDQIFSSQPVKTGPTPASGQGFSPGPSQAQPKAFAQQAQAPASVAGPSFAAPTAGPSFDTLIAQVGTSQDSLANIRNQLNTKNLQFKRSQQHLLRNKLSDASAHLRAANTRLGVETPPMPSQAGRVRSSVFSIMYPTARISWRLPSSKFRICKPAAARCERAIFF